LPERRSNKQRPRTLPTAQLDTFFSGGDVNVRDQSHAPKVTATSDALRTVKEGMKHIQGEHDAHYRAKCFREKTEAHRCSSALVPARREDGPARRGAAAQHAWSHWFFNALIDHFDEVRGLIKDQLEWSKKAPDLDVSASCEAQLEDGIVNHRGKECRHFLYSSCHLPAEEDHRDHRHGNRLTFAHAV